MARFARIDSQIRANRLILANRFRAPELNPFFANCTSRGLRVANRRFEAIRESLACSEFRGFFCESIRANRFARIVPIRVANRWAIYVQERKKGGKQKGNPNPSQAKKNIFQHS